MNIEKLAYLIELYIYINLSFYVLSLIGGLWWLIKKRFFKYVFRKHELWNLQELVDDIDTRLCHMERKREKRDTKNQTKTLQLVRVHHDGKLTKYNLAEQFQQTISDITPADLPLLGLIFSDNQLYLEIKKLGFTGITKITVFETTYAEGGTLGEQRDIRISA